MAVRSLSQQMNRIKKAESWFDQLASYKGDNVDNVVVLVRLFVANPRQEQEMRVELEPDSPEEKAVLDILKAACDKKCAKADKILEENGLERTNAGVRVKGAPKPKKSEPAAGI